MRNSPDAAPMDYAIWGHLNKSEIKTIDELKQKLLYQWRKMDQLFIDKVFASWRKRAYKIFKARGFHIEHRSKL